ncbi:hypothetical protein GCM10011515_07310 [Tsuneonella deserti]|uniref:Uncharacterized protein n=1 Tax=Tsuneonella deserti TaxID=2035528 RepID=A0ABQ1S2F8_9SPHN|nr:hypothetical protein [Tsuneonella deserti]GGD90233.1 hypothetical protein GCM10011515_07310 [Tsuneonella deserti]
MSRRLAVPLAMIAAAVSLPAHGQVRTITPPPAVQAQPSLHQPSNLDLQLQFNQLTEQVSVLAERLAALNQHIASISGSIGTLNARESDHFAQEHATTYVTCKLLYQHHWAPNGANPTPGDPYVPDDYCKAIGWQSQFKD